MANKKHIVKSGDTLKSIAKTYYGDPMKFKIIGKANNISDFDSILVGQELIIPSIEESEMIKNVESKSSGDQHSKILLNPEMLSKIMPRANSNNIQKYYKALNSELPKYRIDTPLRIVHFLAQIAHESGSLNHTAENLNYSSNGLKSVFKKYFDTDELAEQYARNPEKIANRVYANRMKNGNEKSGDGWKFRGRGLIQLTGKENYERCGIALGLDLISNPDILIKDAKPSVAAAAWFWKMRNLNKYADQDDLEKVTKGVNGGTHGLKERGIFLAKAKEVLHV